MIDGNREYIVIFGMYQEKQHLKNLIEIIGVINI